MKVFITKPHGARLGGLEPQLQNKWRMSCKYAGADLSFEEAEKNEIHGEFLTRLWVTKMSDANDIVVLSEIDFLPQRQALIRVADTMRDGGLSFLGTHYVTRFYAPGESVLRSPGKLQAYSCGSDPLVAGWFLALDLRGVDPRSLPEDWLGAGGPRNDAANLAAVRAREAGFLTERNHAYLSFRDAWPSIHGVRYPKIGVHAFWARSLDLPADQVIDFHEQPEPLTAGHHLSNLRGLFH